MRVFHLPGRNRRASKFDRDIAKAARLMDQAFRIGETRSSRRASRKLVRMKKKGRILHY